MPNTPPETPRFLNYPEPRRSAMVAFYESLPILDSSAEVRCPTHNFDGSPIGEDGIPGCGSSNVEWMGDVYDCLDCGIFFSDYAANPPHRRVKE